MVLEWRAAPFTSPLAKRSNQNIENMPLSSGLLNTNQDDTSVDGVMISELPSGPLRITSGEAFNQSLENGKP